MAAMISQLVNPDATPAGPFFKVQIGDNFFGIRHVFTTVSALNHTDKTDQVLLGEILTPRAAAIRAGDVRACRALSTTLRHWSREFIEPPRPPVPGGASAAMRSSRRLAPGRSPHGGWRARCERGPQRIRVRAR